MQAPAQDRHDWQSAEYARAWVVDAESRDQQRAEQLALLAALIPGSPADPMRVLDLGAGYGIVTRTVLGRFPGAQVTLLDYSPAMLDLARERLADRAAQLRYTLGDLSRPGWEQALDGPFDAIVSASALHNLRDATRIAAIYHELVPLLRPGGIFLNLDNVSAGGPRGERLYAALRSALRQARATQRSAADGECVGIDQIAGRGRFPGDVAAHLQWLRAAGFVEVDCFAKWLQRALYGGFVA